MKRLWIALLTFAAAGSAQIPLFQKTVFPVGNGTAMVVTADFNNDGYPDAAVISVVNNAVFVMMNNKDGTFTSSSAYTRAGCTPFYIAAGDFVKDGNPDLLVVCGNSSNYYVLPGDGAGGFGAPLAGSAQTGILVFFDQVRIAIADFNNDGFLDFAFMGYVPGSTSLTGTLNILYGTGKGLFQVGRPVPNIQGNSVAAGDFNNDGKVDLVISKTPSFSSAFLIQASLAATPGSLQVMLGNGDGTFSTGSSLPVNFGPGPVAIADMNGDGRADLVVNGYYSGLQIFLGNGDGSFRSTYSQTVGGGTAGFPVVTDLTGSGTPGVLLAAAMCCSNQVIFLPGNGNGTLQTYAGIPAYNTASVLVADFNADGKPDIGLGIFPTDLMSVARIYLNHDGTAAGTSAFATLVNASKPAPTVSHVNGAGFQAGAAVAAGSIVSAFASGGLANGMDTPSVIPLPTMDLGVTVSVKDPSGSVRLAPLFFLSPGQINYQMPDATAPGVATITITNIGQTYTTTQPVAAVAPGIFQANAATHLVAADITQVHADGSRTLGSTSRLSGGSVVPAPIDLGTATDQVFLTIYATGIKNAKQVSATIGATPVPVTFVGAQGGFVGLDQINAGPLPRSLAGQGQQSLMITADTVAANAVNLTMK